MSTVLAIDTASEEFALAVAIGGQLARSLSRDGAHDHSRLLLAAIDELLGADRAALSGIVAVRGPGSYAGLRVGLATAQGLALAASVPICGVPTLEAAASASGLENVVAIHPAGRGEFAYQQFADGQQPGPISVASTGELGARPGLAGEGAGAFGGVEVSPRARCDAALAIGLERLAAAAPGDLDAIYLREPNITTPRRRVASA